MQELDVQPLIDAGLFPSLVTVLCRLISSSISPSEQAISAHSGYCPPDNSLDASNTSVVEAERLDSASSSSAVASKVNDTGTKEVSSSPGLEAADTVPVTEKPPIDSEDWPGSDEGPLSGDSVLEEPKLSREEDEISDLVEGAHLDEDLANKDADVSVSMLDEVTMEEKRALV